MKESEESNYLTNYQYCKFQETPNDLFKTADSKRKCLAQTFVACNNLTDEATNCDLLEQNLRDYSNLIDNKKGINNYASTIEGFTSKLPHTDCLKWENALNTSNFEDIIKSLQCCSEPKPTETDLKVLFKNQLETNSLPILPRKINEQSETKTVNKRKRNSHRRSKHRRNRELDEQYERRHVFRTAAEELQEQRARKYGSEGNGQALSSESGQNQKRSLGSSRGVGNRFIPPYRNECDESGQTSREDSTKSNLVSNDEVVDERLRNIEPKMIELICSEIMDSSSPITWDDIAGLDFAKTTIKEVIVWPMLRPDIFTGLRRPPKGMLLFGPPGTGKTLIGKCIASQSKSTFFSISASSLTSKYFGDGEKMVRAMFAVARCHQPAVIFIDEIDSLLSQRTDTEHECTRRIKTEFLVQLDGATTGENDRILVIGATNRPQELDEAARRRFVKRLYIPLPEEKARFDIIKRLINTEKNDLSDENIEEIAALSDGYSGSDMKCLCSEASLGPIRSIDINMIENIHVDMVRPITIEDFRNALKRVRASVSINDLDQYVQWDRTYGAGI